MSDKKEKNYSIWFTGIVLLFVYIILLDNMSEKKESVCKSILKDQIQNTSEAVWNLMQKDYY